MGPAHVAPGIAFGIVLVKKVVLAVEIDQAVGVVRPVLRRGIVVRRAVVAGLDVGDGGFFLLLGGAGGEENGKGEECEQGAHLGKLLIKNKF